jgi:hypothetical protein
MRDASIALPVTSAMRQALNNTGMVMSERLMLQDMPPNLPPPNFTVVLPGLVRSYCQWQPLPGASRQLPGIVPILIFVSYLSGAWLPLRRLHESHVAAMLRRQGSICDSASVHARHLQIFRRPILPERVRGFREEGSGCG